MVFYKMVTFWSQFLVSGDRVSTPKAGFPELVSPESFSGLLQETAKWKKLKSQEAF